jgi:hypothetical protein
VNVSPSAALLTVLVAEHDAWAPTNINAQPIDRAQRIYIHPLPERSGDHHHMG